MTKHYGSLTRTITLAEQNATEGVAFDVKIFYFYEYNTTTKKWQFGIYRIEHYNTGYAQHRTLKLKNYNTSAQGSLNASSLDWLKYEFDAYFSPIYVNSDKYPNSTSTQQNDNSPYWVKYSWSESNCPSLFFDPQNANNLSNLKVVFNFNISGQSRMYNPIRWSNWSVDFSITINVPGNQISYDTETTQDQTKWQDEPITLRPAASFSGYTFKRWNTNSSDTGTGYNAEQTYNANADLTLHAIWNHIVEYNANGGTGQPSTQVDLKSNAIILSSTTPTRAEHLFYKWNTKADGSGVDYHPGDTILAEARNLLLYAIWEYYRKPAITSVLCTRCDSRGNLENEGTYMLVQINWRITKYRSTTAPINIITEAKLNDTTINTNTQTQFDPTISGDNITGTTEFVMAGPFDTDQRYNVSITIADTLETFTIQDILTEAFYPWDVLRSGRGVAFGKPATQENLLDVGYDINSDGDVTCVALHQTSDKRAKKHLEYLGEEAAEMIDALEPALFIHEGKKLMGFYAQDVQDADVYESDIVSDGPGAYLTLNYTALLAPLVAYVQMLEERIVDLENKENE